MGLGFGFLGQGMFSVFGGLHAFISMSAMPSYAFSEGLAWFRFPLFAMATAFWLGTDKRLLYAMLVSTALGMILMTGILTAEMIIEGQKGGRLSWPYDDLVSGNYLSKVGLPAFTIMVALAIGAKPKLASIMGGLSLISIIMSVLTGERINFLIRACGGMLAALVWQPNWRRYIILIIVEIFAVVAVFVQCQMFKTGSPMSCEQPSDRSHSDYYRVMGLGLKRLKQHLFLALGLPHIVNYAQSILGETPEFRCDNHPHNFYIQFLTETGVIGLITGSCDDYQHYLGGLCWLAAKPRQCCCRNGFCDSVRVVFPDSVNRRFLWPMEQYFHVECDCPGTCRGQNLVPRQTEIASSPDYPRPIKGIFGAITVMN